MLGRHDKFSIWYKRRIGRIWPSLLAWCTLVGPIIFNLNYTWKDLYLGGNFCLFNVLPFIILFSIT